MPLSILDALDDPALFGPLFTPAEGWGPWRAFLGALFGLPLSEADLEVYRRGTGRREPPGSPAREAWVVVGRRGGKSRVAALVAVYLACFRSYDDVLAAGEQATIMLLASDRRQARTLMRYVVGMLEAVPMLCGLIANRTAESLELANGVVIEIHTASFRAVRGYSVVAALCDELAYWRDDTSANPDSEIVAALRPAMATIPGALLLCISSPYARRGALWETYRAHHGHDADPVLTWQADTRSMNPTVPEHIIAHAYAEDESVAAAEYGARFRSDLESYISPEIIGRLVAPGVHERGPSWVNRYVAFCDPAGGSGGDSMTLAVAHFDRATSKALLDVIAEVRPPFNPETVVEEFAEVLARYQVRVVTGDKFGGDWPSAAFKRHHIAYRPSERTKSEIYRDALPILNSGGVELLDDARLVRQLLNLERRTGSSGRDIVDHGPNGHDDLVNAALGSVLLASAAGRRRGVGQVLGDVRVIPTDFQAVRFGRPAS